MARTPDVSRALSRRNLERLEEAGKKKKAQEAMRRVRTKHADILKEDATSVTVTAKKEPGVELDKDGKRFEAKVSALQRIINNPNSSVKRRLAARKKLAALLK